MLFYAFICKLSRRIKIRTIVSYVSIYSQKTGNTDDRALRESALVILLFKLIELADEKIPGVRVGPKNREKRGGFSILFFLSRFLLLLLLSSQ